MSQRRTTVPPTRVSSRSSHRGRSELIARENEKQSAKERTTLDNRFHRTDLAPSGAGRKRRSIALASMPKRAAWRMSRMALR